MVGGGEGKDSTASMAKRNRELEEQLGLRKKEGAALPSGHRHASSTPSNRGDGGAAGRRGRTSTWNKSWTARRS
jgi:hypothetical protein